MGRPESQQRPLEAGGMGVVLDLGDTLLRTPPLPPEDGDCVAVFTPMTDTAEEDEGVVELCASRAAMIDGLDRVVGVDNGALNLEFCELQIGRNEKY